MRRGFMLLSVVLIAGCVSNNPAQSDFKIVEIEYRDGHSDSLINGFRPVYLKADYGYIIDWPKGRKPSFHVFDRPRGLRFQTGDWNEFLAQIQRLPDGIEIDRVRKCSVPFAWGMPREKYEEFLGVFAAKGLRRVDIDDSTKHVMFCYCESKGFRVLADKQPE